MPHGEIEYQVLAKENQKLCKEIAYMEEQYVRELRIWEEKLLDHNTKNIIVQDFLGDNFEFVAMSLTFRESMVGGNTRSDADGISGEWQMRSKGEIL
ncbi:hypothetical protein Zmor_018093 [Zophobas morio]|uniref:Uncharacterized protein n=1 Tax=Zophobas morio TaxID=2755281 RepID=A0AA38I9V7_9CUCU|nr:hypothetical protein Zmor_018093 [Zophobas morio]